MELDTAEAWGDIPEVGRVVFSPRAQDPNVACVAWVRVGDDVWSVEDASYDLREGHAPLRELADRLLVSVARKRSARRVKKR